MNESVDETLRDRFARVVRASDDSDWGDVRRRAADRLRRQSRRAALAGALLLIVVATPAFAVSDRIVGLFGEGKPVPQAALPPDERERLSMLHCVNVEFATKQGQAPRKRCEEGRPRITEIARNEDRFYWKLSYPDGTVCLAEGVAPLRKANRVDTNGRVGLIKCPADVPSPERPITTDVVVEATREQPQPYLWRVSGLAGEGITSVALVAADGATLERAVEGHIYAFEKIPPKKWVALAAFDADGDQVYRERLPVSRAVVSSRGALVRSKPPTPPRPAAGARPLQHAEVRGARADVYRSGLVVVRVTAPGAQAHRLSKATSVSVSCSRLAYGAGKWAMIVSGAPAAFADAEIRAMLHEPGVASHARAQRRFDACSVRGTSGRRWNGGRAMHDPVEIPFSALGRRFFDEQAIARDLAFFVRSPKMRAVRLAMKRGEEAPSSQELTQRFPSRVVTLTRAGDVPPRGKIGVWANKRDLVVSERTAAGRRLFVKIRAGRIAATNIGELALVF